MLYESLLMEATRDNIDVYEQKMKPTIKGLYYDRNVLINRNLPAKAEKACVLAEEIGHHHTSVGNILDLKKLSNLKQELRARYWAYKRLVPLSAFVQAHRQGIQNRHELAEFLGITEEFLTAAIKRYKDKYGLFVAVDGYTVCFEPLGVLEWFE